MTEKILLVDDEENILHSIRRELRKRFDIHTAGSGAEALEILKSQGPFAVIISDMRMPLMDGVQLLSKVKDLYPDVVRLMLTGNADQETAIDAVNKGQIFRFLSKPCPTATLVTAIALAQRQYRLITAERELLDQTLKGSISVLSELLGLANPMAFSSGSRIKKIVGELADGLGLPNLWQYEVAALMSQIGCVTLPNETLAKVYAGLPLDAEEEAMYRSHPETGARLLSRIPRLDAVAAIIANQLTDYGGFRDDAIDEDIALGAQILRIALDHDLLLYRGKRHQEALSEMRREIGKYNPAVLDLLEQTRFDRKEEQIMSVDIDELRVGMIVERNIVSTNDVLIIPKGQEITWPILQGLRNFSRQVRVQEPLLVRIRGDL
ncbi:MAG: response regulator [Desulfobulbaceae bacterium]|nr:MAG: response regulator [Desulfobulbaceae bacterium]